MRHTPTSQESADWLQLNHGHRARDAVAIRASGGSEPEITLPETCLEIRSVWKMKKLPQPLHPQILAHPPLSLVGRRRHQTHTDQSSPPLSLVGWRRPPTSHVEHEVPI